MNTPVLNDKDQFPTEAVIFSHIGKSKTIWETFFEYLKSAYSEFSGEWRYYNDGKSWLMKMTGKSKTIFWLSIIPNAFCITFYFGDKAESLILESKLSDKIKTEFAEGKRYGKIRGITLMMDNKKNIEYAKELISIKIKLK